MNTNAVPPVFITWRKKNGGSASDARIADHDSEAVTGSAGSVNGVSDRRTRRARSQPCPTTNPPSSTRPGGATSTRSSPRSRPGRSRGSPSPSPSRTSRRRATACRARPCCSTCTTSPTAASTATSPGLAPLPDLYPVFPDYDLELQRKCMDLVRAHTDVPAPEVRVLRARHRMARHAVPRDAPHRRRGAARHPAVRVRRLGDGRVAGTAAQAAGRDRERARPAARDHAGHARPVVPRAAAARHERARPAARLPAVVLRLGAQRRVVPADRAHARVARRQPARRGRAGAQLGRRPDRQRPLRRLRAGRGARLGDGDHRPARGRPRLDDLPRHVLRRPRRALRAAARSPGSWTATTSSPTTSS